MTNVRVKIIGAGSIGNHLAHACRNRDWDVTVFDVSHDALIRMEKIYAQRYGKWDLNIHCSTMGVKHPKFDVIFIGTPPDTHMKLALQAIEEQPRILVIEKPLCQPSEHAFNQLAELGARRRIFSKDTMVLVGYNHLMTPAVQELVKEVKKSTVKGITVTWQESWKGIFAAHPWLSGPSASYLGFIDRGGGASGEHSHGLNLWQYLAHTAGWGRVMSVRCQMDMKEADGCYYDELAGMNLRTERGHEGGVLQDVLLDPAIKIAMVNTLQKGPIIWQYRGKPDHDVVTLPEAGGEYTAKMTRPDDFKYEVAHIADLLSGKEKYVDSPMHINRGIETMQVLYYARKSSEAGGKSVDVPKWFSEF